MPPIRIARQLLAPLALALGASVANAALDLSGAAHGRYQVWSARAITLEGVVEASDGRRLHHMRATLLGDSEQGQVHGRLTEILVPGAPANVLNLEYDVIGVYQRDENELLHFYTVLYLAVDLGSQAVYVPVGEMDGVLRAPVELAGESELLHGYCPGAMAAGPVRDPELFPMAGGAAGVALLQVPVEARRRVLARGVFQARYALY